MKHGGEMKVNPLNNTFSYLNFNFPYLERKHRRQIHISIRKSLFKAKTFFATNPAAHKFKLHFNPFQKPKRTFSKHLLKFDNR